MRGLLVRSLIGSGLVLAAATAVIGGIALRPGGLVAVGLAGLVAACLAAGIAREAPRATARSTAEAAWRSGGVAVAVLLVLSGTSVLGGAVLSLLVVGVAVAVGAAVWLLRTRGGRGPASWAGAPLDTLSTGELSREWARTSAALAGDLPPSARAALVGRREETLDELERRDPAGFARWLASTPLPSADPAAHVRDGDPA